MLQKLTGKEYGWRPEDKRENVINGIRQLVGLESTDHGGT